MSEELNGVAGADRDDRDQFIPIRKSALLAALIAHGRLRKAEEREQFSQLCRLLGAIFHYEYFEWLEKLRDDYFYFNPDVAAAGWSDPQVLEQARTELLSTLDTVLKGANYKEIAFDDVKKAHAERASLKVKVQTTMDDYHEVRFFRRGHHEELIDTRKWFGLRRSSIPSSTTSRRNGASVRRSTSVCTSLPGGYGCSSFASASRNETTKRNHK